MLKKLEGPKVVWRKTNVYVPKDGDETSFAKYTVKLQFEIAPRSVNDERMSNYKSTEPDTDWLLEAIKGWGDYVDRRARTSRSTPRSCRRSSTCPITAWPRSRSTSTAPTGAWASEKTDRRGRAHRLL
jgi:hypothetical protein